ncbi:RNA polymerase sigma factor FliA [Pigmentiphaga kullae]|uniref:RNA polymerase sigma factor FliA n=1 Tax=Pigmentiphaga kullae TaxID=151784 RepID=A0A4Q7N9N8_9BURK|nr:RNA polymerase sigma factor FliA [Pigmentiphaga kullae]RZS78724.1 RNA polymerase sigma-28 (SigD/FliA/WhiG) subunit [Pigmentiphaga kullae]
MYTREGTLARETNVEQYVPMVRRMAHHMVARLPASVQIEDLIQAGMLGLLDALGRFEEGLGAQFETYATQRIRGAMLDELRRGDWLPRSVRQVQRKIEAAMHRSEQRLGRSPSDAEMAAELEVELGEYQQMLADARGVQLFHYEDLDSSEDADDYLDRHMPADGAGDPQARLSDRRFREAVVNGIERLPEREKLVMGMYYEQDMNFKEIAAVLGVTESRICQLHTQAVSRLRTRLKEWGR